MLIVFADSTAFCTMSRSASQGAQWVLHLVITTCLLSISVKRCLFSFVSKEVFLAHDKNRVPCECDSGSSVALWSEIIAYSLLWSVHTCCWHSYYTGRVYLWMWHIWPWNPLKTCTSIQNIIILYVSVNLICGKSVHVLQCICQHRFMWVLKEQRIIKESRRIAAQFILENCFQIIYCLCHGD